MSKAIKLKKYFQKRDYFKAFFYFNKGNVSKILKLEGGWAPQSSYKVNKGADAPRTTTLMAMSMAGHLAPPFGHNCTVLTNIWNRDMMETNMIHSICMLRTGFNNYQNLFQLLSIWYSCSVYSMSSALVLNGLAESNFITSFVLFFMKHICSKAKVI